MAKIIDGKLLAGKIKTEAKQEIADLVRQGHRPPCLAVILVGENPASQLYVAHKEKACIAAGIRSQTYRMPLLTTQELVAEQIENLNNDDSVDAILLQLPLPPALNKVDLINLIDPHKDVDGLTSVNQGLLVWHQPGIYPCTPLGILELLKSQHASLKGKVAAVVGRSVLVGASTANLLSNAGATIISMHSESLDCKYWTRQAEIVVVATGVHHLVQADWIKPGATVIDVGIHRVGNNIEGDVNFAEVSKVAGAISPVPGGVGPMTIAMLLKNCLQAHKMRHGLVR